MARRISLKKRYPFNGKRTRNLGGNVAPKSDMVSRGTRAQMIADGHLITADRELCIEAQTPARHGHPFPITLTPGAYAACGAAQDDTQEARRSLYGLLASFGHAVRAVTGPRTGLLDFAAIDGRKTSGPNNRIRLRALMSRDEAGTPVIVVSLAPAA
jgi:hypothetical protein